MNHTITSEREKVSRAGGRLRVGVLCSFAVLAAPAAGTCGPAPLDLTGTWISKVTMAGQMTVPVAGTTGVSIEVISRLVVTKSGGNLVHKVQFCKLATTTTNPTLLVVTYTPAVLATMVATASIPDYTPTVGGALTIPQLVIQTGSNKVCNGACVEADYVDSDADGQPGVTLPSVLNNGALSLKAYSALTITDKNTAVTLTDANTMSGGVSYVTDGQVLRNDNPGVPGGVIKVVPTAASTPFTAKRLAGDVPCSTVLTMF